MVQRQVAHPGVDERRARGNGLRGLTPLVSHSGWEPAPGRPGPVDLPEAQNRTREPDLVPVRHGRMVASPFTFYRGAARIMAADIGKHSAALLRRRFLTPRPPGARVSPNSPFCGAARGHGAWPCRG